ncbi:Metallo-dependent phosphatase-like protein, partial [Phaeosphaeriaceae sp. PMI808]
TRKTRIVCISDTHNQTPKLPLGDVLIHAGDLTNQGSYAELKKTVEWIEKADFEAKIVIAGNHDTTLDEPFFHGSSNKWKWPQPQDPVKCRKLLTESTSITYLENEVAVIYLTSHNGPKTRFKIFGSPFSSGRRGWAFQYVEEADAVDLWEKIEEDVDIVVTHNPAYGHCDTAAKKQAGCPILLKRLALTRPMLHVCGHIHAGRGAERITWAPLSHTHNPPIGQPTTSLVESVEHWNDPGAGNKKLSLLDLTAK